VKELPYDTNELIAALATPWAESALAVVRTSGEGCISAVAKVFSRAAALLSAEDHSLVYGFLMEEDGRPVDQVVLGVYLGGHGYTGQEAVEIFCHGSLPGIQRILELLRSAGFRDAAPGEFSMRAFLNGRIDLTEAEAVREIISAKSRRAQELALNRLSGAVHRRIDGIKERVKKLLSIVEVQLDYPEDEYEAGPELPLEEIEALPVELEGLLSTYRTGRIYQQGVAVAIAGPTNAGKSALFNLFLREDRSIVSGVHGTTRDYIESWITISGVPVRLFDTAGFREAEHPVEAEGIRRSGRIVDSAALVLYLVDGSLGLSPAEEEVFKNRRGDCRYIFVWNKTDLAGGPVPEGWLGISAETGAGFADLEGEIGRRLLGTESGDTAVVIDSERQHRLLRRAHEALETARGSIAEGVAMDFVAADLKEAMDALGEITGEVSSEDILEQIFGDFCVGK
jgi:tRNA modification GTPase